MSVQLGSQGAKRLEAVLASAAIIACAVIGMLLTSQNRSVAQADRTDQAPAWLQEVAQEAASAYSTKPLLSAAWTLTTLERAYSEAVQDTTLANVAEPDRPRFVIIMTGSFQPARHRYGKEPSNGSTLVLVVEPDTHVINSLSILSSIPDVEAIGSFKPLEVTIN